MIRRIMLFASTSGALAVLGTAYADSQTQQANRLRAEVAVELGQRATGRNIVRWGVLKSDGTRRPADHAELISYGDILSRMLTPSARSPTGSPASARTSSASPSSAPGAATAQNTAGTSGASSSGSLPACTWQPESGGNWSAVNSSSGAGGYYQILPST
jgi:hypothetical protein